MLAYMYYSNGKPIIERDYYAPGQVTWQQAEVRLEQPLKLGETRLIHMGHGVFRRFECVDVDATHALLQGCNG